VGRHPGATVDMSPKRRQIRSTDGGSTWQPIGQLIHAFGNASCYGSMVRAGRSLIFSHPFAHGPEATCWKHGTPAGWPGLARCNGTLFISRDEGSTWQPWQQATSGNASQLFAYSDLTLLKGTGGSEPPSLSCLRDVEHQRGLRGAFLLANVEALPAAAALRPTCKVGLGSYIDMSWYNANARATNKD
jgi:hypothetical protein